DYTWYDYFAGSAVNTIKEYKALLLDAEKKGFVYDDFAADYESLQSDLKKSADEAGVSLKEYYKSVFGGNATQKNVKPYIEDYLKASAYEKQLQSKLAASEAEINDYYEENKDTYDQVTYRQFIIDAETQGDEAAMKAAKEKAETMMSAVTDEAAFAQQCRVYATQEQAEAYEAEEGSLLSDKYKTSVDAPAADWVFDSARIKGDVTVIEDTDNSKYYVLYYVSRRYDESNNEKIADTLLDKNYNELISEYTEKMTVDNVKNRIKMLKDE
ncbi:MAG: peptidyl-prolyl cis-trans isomerase, partial [Eubacteriales bacterium]|nr:peptidyl-prolyl cis-trans isomerase [Eubacteriales bacterium]